MKRRATAVPAGVLASSAAYAGKAPPPPPPPPPAATTTSTFPTTRTQNHAYAGLRWDLPGPLAPSLVVGVRRARTESDGDTRGFDLSFAFAFIDGLKPGKLRLKAFTGHRDAQAEIGGGFDFGAWTVFAGPSVNFPFVNLGVDWSVGGGLQPYGMVHTLGKPNRPDPLTVTTTAPAPPPPPPPPPGS